MVKSSRQGVKAVDWRAVVRGAAPQLAKALGGPLAGVAVKAAAERVLGAAGAAEADLAEALSAPTAEHLHALREAEKAFLADMRRLDIDLERIAAGDRANARARQAQLGDRTPSVLGVAVIVGFFGVLIGMLSGALPDGAETEFSIMLGALATMTAAVVNYFFGSSAGSARKTDLLALKDD
ncbi:MAG: hypothetical protein AAGC95_18345 [Pseudomonadota bacterium]